MLSSHTWPSMTDGVVQVKLKYQHFSGTLTLVCVFFMFNLKVIHNRTFCSWCYDLIDLMI